MPNSVASGLAVEQARQRSDRTSPLTPEWLVTTYLPRVHMFAVMVCPPGADPEDLAQQAMTRTLERIQQFDPARGTVDAWLWRIVVNVARDTGRLLRRRELLRTRLQAIRDGNAAHESAEASALQQYRDQELIAAVRRLPRRYRGLIALRYGADLSSAEIAEQLGITRMSAVKALRRAIDRLRAELQSSEVDS